MGVGPGNLGGQLGIHANAVTRCGVGRRLNALTPIGGAPEICWSLAQQLVEESEGPMSGQFVNLDSSRVFLLE